ncbi:MAG: hypothetical protein R2730_00255 [Chitinophagales bacterium]
MNKSSAKVKKAYSKDSNTNCEFEQLLSEALKTIDSELMETIKLVSEMETKSQELFEVTTSCSGTSFNNSLYAG